MNTQINLLWTMLAQEKTILQEILQDLARETIARLEEKPFLVGLCRIPKILQNLANPEKVLQEFMQDCSCKKIHHFWKIL